MENTGPIFSKRSQEKSAVTSAHDALKEIMSTDGSVKDDEGSEDGSRISQEVPAEEAGGVEEPDGEIKPKVSVKTIKRVLELLCDESVSGYRGNENCWLYHKQHSCWLDKNWNIWILPILEVMLVGAEQCLQIIIKKYSSKPQPYIINT